ncbi:hypothetical protein [Leptospira perolatii]|uniref:hypothetical protein n=1 Tax=Leptospira perolatii TaxID=2023191 RepID=UPI001A9CAEBC|nr:hypothetical protein [Leptospira perolatii]
MSTVWWNLVEKFREYCPNKEFLTWDPDLRWIVTLNLADSIRRIDVLEILRIIFDSPTWPVFRNVLEVPFVYFFGTSGQVPGYITSGIFLIQLLLLPVCIFCLVDGKRNIKFILSVFLYPVVWGSLLQNPGFMLYTFTGMLEVQGALLYLLSLTFFLLWQGRTTVSKRVVWLGAISSFLLFQTKYPYGYLFLITSLSLILLESSKETILELFKKWIQFLNRSPLYFKVLFLLAIFSFLASFLLPLKGKGPGLLRYVSCWMLFAVFIIFFKAKKDEIVYQKLSEFWKFWIAPVVFWVLLHPDRFLSSQSTISHVQSEGIGYGVGRESGFIFYTVYIKEFLNNSHYNAMAAFLIFAIWIFGIVELLFRRIRGEEISQGQRILFLCGASYTILTVFTPNHQVRHVYHLYPSLLVGIGLVLWRGVHGFSQRKIVVPITSLLFVGLLSTTAGYFLWNRNSVWSRTNLCFSGVAKEVYEFPNKAERKLRQITVPGRMYVFWNLLPDHSYNKPDLDLAAYRAGYENKALIQEKRKSDRINWEQSVGSPMPWILAALNCQEIESRICIPEEKENCHRELAKGLRLIEFKNGCIGIWESPFYSTPKNQ